MGRGGGGGGGSGGGGKKIAGGGGSGIGGKYSSKPTQPLTEGEKAGLDKYVNSKEYGPLNNAMNNDLPLTDEQATLATNIKSGVNKLPSYPKTTYRNVSFFEGGELSGEKAAAFAAQHVPGQTITYKGFTSATKYQRNYGYKNRTYEGAVRMRFERSAQMKDMRAAGRAEDVVANAGATFRVVSVTKLKTGGWDIVLTD